MVFTLDHVWHFSVLTSDLVDCVRDASLMRPIKLMSPERSVIRGKFAAL